MTTRIEELEEKLEKMRVARQSAEDAQYERDLEARIELESEHGALAGVKCTRYVEGQPTRAYVRTPTGAEYKRYKDRVHRAIDKKNVAGQGEAGEQLARACWIYPKTEEERASMLDAFPGLLSSITVAATALAEGKNEETGKG